jgi:hypothetical protein
LDPWSKAYAHLTSMATLNHAAHRLSVVGVTRPALECLLACNQKIGGDSKWRKHVTTNRLVQAVIHIRLNDHNIQVAIFFGVPMARNATPVTLWLLESRRFARGFHHRSGYQEGQG